MKTNTPAQSVTSLRHHGLKGLRGKKQERPRYHIMEYTLVHTLKVFNNHQQPMKVTAEN